MAVNCVSWDPDGNFLAVGSGQQIRIYSPKWRAFRFETQVEVQVGSDIHACTLHQHAIGEVHQCDTFVVLFVLTLDQKRHRFFGFLASSCTCTSQMTVCKLTEVTLIMPHHPSFSSSPPMCLHCLPAPALSNSAALPLWFQVLLGINATPVAAFPASPLHPSLLFCRNPRGALCCLASLCSRHQHSMSFDSMLCHHCSKRHNCSCRGPDLNLFIL